MGGRLLAWRDSLLAPCPPPRPLLPPLVVVELGLEAHVGGRLLLQPGHQLVNLGLELGLALRVVRDVVLHLLLFLL